MVVEMEQMTVSISLRRTRLKTRNLTASNLRRYFYSVAFRNLSNPSEICIYLGRVFSGSDSNPRSTIELQILGPPHREMASRHECMYLYIPAHHYSPKSFFGREKLREVGQQLMVC